VAVNGPIIDKDLVPVGGVNQRVAAFYNGCLSSVSKPCWRTSTRLGAVLLIYHVRKAREFRRSFLLAATVFQNKSLILDSEGPGNGCGARH
jgi:hypothetical protein